MKATLLFAYYNNNTLYFSYIAVCVYEEARGAALNKFGKTRKVKIFRQETINFFLISPKRIEKVAAIKVQ